MSEAVALRWGSKREVQATEDNSNAKNPRIPLTERQLGAIVVRPCTITAHSLHKTMMIEPCDRIAGLGKSSTGIDATGRHEQRLYAHPSYPVTQNFHALGVP